MLKFLNIIAIMFLIIMMVCAVLYFIKGIYYPMGIIAMILYFWTLIGIQLYKKRK